MSKYSDLLKHPKWQKKRLEILNRDNFSCQRCFDDESMLIVHHLFYRKNKNPWEYPNFALVTLCQDCHESEHDFDELNKDSDLVDDLKKCGLPASIINDLPPTFKIISESENVYFIYEVFVSLIVKISMNKISWLDVVEFMSEKEKK